MKREKTIKDLSSPVHSFFKELEKIVGKDSEFAKHFSQSRAEFLKSIRSLIDAKIERLEKSASGESETKLTKINVQE